MEKEESLWAELFYDYNIYLPSSIQTAYLKPCYCQNFWWIYGAQCQVSFDNHFCWPGSSTARLEHVFLISGYFIDSLTRDSLFSWLIQSV